MKFVLNAAFLHALLCTTANFGVVNGAGDTRYTYFEAGGLGPLNWASLDIRDADGVNQNQCGGTGFASGYGQSPVTIPEDTMKTGFFTCDSGLADYVFEAGDCTWDQMVFKILNNGVWVGPKEGECKMGRMKIPHTPNYFNALQFHIHTSSEHTFAGEYFKAELHVVHQEDNGKSFAVFGTMIDVGDEDHPVFEGYLQNWEKLAQSVEDTCATKSSTRRRHLRSLADDTASVLVQQKVQCPAVGSAVYSDSATNGTTVEVTTPDIYRDLPTAGFGTFTYKGGLTTPPCTEIVNWNLLDKPMYISQSQLDRLEMLILCFVSADTCTHSTVADEAGSTSRPPQPLGPDPANERHVLHRCPGGPNTQIVDTVPNPAQVVKFVKPADAAEPDNTKSAKCNKAWTEKCPSDPRYDPNVSPNLKSTAPIWKDLQGLWVGTMTSTDRLGNPIEPGFYAEQVRNSYPYSRQDAKVFINRTISETRFYEHTYIVLGPAPKNGFCELPVPDDASNVIGNGVCGDNGYVLHGERFGDATHEKDGGVQIFLGNGRYAGTTGGTAIPITDNNLYIDSQGVDFAYSSTDVFTNDDKTRISGSGTHFLFLDVLPYSLDPYAESYNYVLYQVSEEDFEKAIKTAYSQNGIIEEDQLPAPMTGNCLDPDNCYTEEMFQKYDPNYTETPYEEDTGANAGFIAGMAILGAIIVFGGLYFLHDRQVKKQQNRYKHEFAKRIAQTIGVQGDHHALTPEALEEEFKRIDDDNNGWISKTEMRDFMESGKAGKMTDNDFEAMFKAIDTDGDGHIEFAEFCAFLATSRTVYDEESKAFARASMNSNKSHQSRFGSTKAEQPIEEEDEPEPIEEEQDEAES